MIPPLHTSAGLQTAGAGNLSGAAWWHANQAKYPNSKSVEDLAPAFRTSVKKFLAALAEAGASVSIETTRRNQNRAYLMHYSWMIAHGQIDSSKVPLVPGVNIVWDHSNAAASRSAAQQMVGLFQMAHIAALNSNHISGNAIDMNINWTGIIQVKDSTGHPKPIGAPNNEAHNAALHSLGGGYGVRKLLSDPPHWSVNGH